MAEIEAFRAWRYNPKIGDIKNLTSPLFDVVDKSQIQSLYEIPFNSIHISVPENNLKVAETINSWKSKKIIQQDDSPCIYVYYQYYKINNSPELKCRKGFICNIKIHEWEEQIILRHESVIPHSVSDRLEVLEKSEMNISPTHGLYTDKDLNLESYMDESMQTPIYEFTDYQAVLNKLSIIKEPQIIELFKTVLKDKQIILADGHHRYSASLEYRKKIKNNNYDFKDTDPSNFHCIYLSNTESNDLAILPTHRLINGILDFNEMEIIKKLNDYFLVEFIESPNKVEELISKTKHSFGVLFKEKSLIIKLKESVLKEINWNFPNEVKDLDLTIMHFFIIEKIFGIKGMDQKNWNKVNYSPIFTKVVSNVLNGSIQMAVITRGITIEEIKKICYSGFTFPHKSTFFYPKVVCGLLFSSIKKNEFFIENKL